MQFKILLSPPNTSFRKTNLGRDYITLYPSFSSARMGRIYILSPSVLDKNPIPPAKHLQYVESLLAHSGVIRLFITLPKSIPDNVVTSQGYQKDLFIYYTKTPQPNMDISNSYLKELSFKYIDMPSPDIISLFTQYLTFYKQPNDKVQSARYLTERLQNKESLIVQATYKNTIVGFVQLYRDFSIPKLAYTLNDLFVDPSYRNLGIAFNLMTYVEYDLYQKGVTLIKLKTAPDNPARKLYERLQYKEEIQYTYYYKELTTLSTEDYPCASSIKPLNLLQTPQITLYKLSAHR